MEDFDFSLIGIDEDKIRNKIIKSIKNCDFFLYTCVKQQVIGQLSNSFQTEIVEQIWNRYVEQCLLQYLGSIFIY